MKWGRNGVGPVGHIGTSWLLRNADDPTGDGQPDQRHPAVPADPRSVVGDEAPPAHRADCQQQSRCREQDNRCGKGRAMDLGIRAVVPKDQNDTHGPDDRQEPVDHSTQLQLRHAISRLSGGLPRLSARHAGALPPTPAGAATAAAVRSAATATTATASALPATLCTVSSRHADARCGNGAQSRHDLGRAGRGWRAAGVGVCVGVGVWRGRRARGRGGLLAGAEGVFGWWGGGSVGGVGGGAFGEPEDEGAAYA